MTSGGTQKIYYSTVPPKWTLSGYSNTIQVFSPTTSSIPTSNWVILGGLPGSSVVVSTGTCTASTTLTISVAKNSGSRCTGVLTIIGTGGTPPYTYSNDGGSTFVSTNLFTSLCYGTYDCRVKDSTGLVVAQSVILS
jgi:hypothetical protein